MIHFWYSMATAKTRINISVSQEMERALSRLAKRDQVPTATKAAALLNVALEIEEDRYFSELADKRLKDKGRWLSHEAVWGRKHTR